MEHPSIEEGRELMHEFVGKIHERAEAADNKLLFFAGLAGGMVGQMAAAIGKDGSIAVLEVVRPIMEQVADKHGSPVQ